MTGKAIPLVEVDAPTPIEEVASGPIAINGRELSIEGIREFVSLKSVWRA